MAITYFAITSTSSEGGPTENLDTPAAVAAKAFGIVHIWTEGTPATPSDKWVVVGDGILTGDSARLRSIPVQLKQRMLASLQAQMDVSRAQLADYGLSLRRGFCVDIKLSAADVGAL
jgi:hypothetical protein